MKRVSTLIALAVLLLGQAALAQRVVVLEFDGDKKGKLRTQVETALKKAKVVEVIPLKKYKDAAAKKKVKGARAMTPAGVKAVAKTLSLDAAVEGAIGDDFFVRILDPQGAELWSRNLPLKKGLISADNARRLAKAIAAAAQAGQETKPAEEQPKEEEKTEEHAEEKTEEKTSENEKTETTEEKTEEKVTTLPEVTVPDEGGGSKEEREKRQQEELAESHTVVEPTESVKDQDLDEEQRKPKVRAAPHLIQVQLLATVTWRSYCARPGVATCAEYDLLAADQQPQGVTINFSAQFPYMGVQLGLELFPLAPITDSALNGIGLVGYFGRGFALARVRSESAVDGTPPKEVIALDDSYLAALTYRYHFLLGDERKPLVGYVGLKGGLMGRSFEVDPTANSPLPGSHRAYPMVGLDVSIPLISYFRVEAGGSYFIGPRPGIDEIAGFGTDATGSGFGGEFGFAGELWGPIGYIAKLRYARYKDSYTGVGNRWTNVDHGAAEESYTTALIGLTASF